MTNKFFSMEEKNHTAFITMGDPKISNGMDIAAALELDGICRKINGSPDISLIVLSGGGDVFGGTYDVNEILNAGVDIKTPAEAIASLNRPVIAALKGDALDEGFELALACDIRIAANTIKLGLSGIAGGKMPSDGATQRLPRIAGKGKALEMILTGEIIDAPEAYRYGILNQITAPEQFEDELNKLTAKLSAKAPFALQYAKEAVNKGPDLTLEQGLKLEADLYFLLHTTEDRTEGIRAFQQKRNPEFKGN
jgi:enoyl-CoA hydratase/carnithine racemase